LTQLLILTAVDDERRRIPLIKIAIVLAAAAAGAKAMRKI